MGQHFTLGAGPAQIMEQHVLLPPMSVARTFSGRFQQHICSMKNKNTKYTQINTNKSAQ